MPAKKSTKKIFQLSLRVSQTENEINIIRDCEPKIEVVVKPDCAICKRVVAFLTPKCHVTTSRFFKGVHEHCHEIYYRGHNMREQISIDLDMAKYEKNKKKPKKSEDSLGTVDVVEEKESDPLKIVDIRLKRCFEVNEAPPPLKQQTEILEKFKQTDAWEKYYKYFMYLKMGSGKTIAVLMVLRDTPQKTVWVVCSNTLLGYWASEIEKMPQGSGSTQFKLVGYTQFGKLAKENANLVKGKVVIVDEAHHYRNFSKPMEVEVTSINMAKNVFLLTGTPIVNDTDDLYGFVRLMGYDVEREDITPKFVEKIFKDGNITHYDPKLHDKETFSENYPEVETRIVRVPMSCMQTFEYLMKMYSLVTFGHYQFQSSKSNSYDSNTRLLSNAMTDDHYDSNKFTAIVKNIEALGAYPQAIYSHYVDRGVRCQDKLAAKKLPQLKRATIDGSTASANRKKTIDLYNKKQVDLLFFTDASREGVDLHGTVAQHMTEPCLNLESEGQTVARTIRFGSHKNSEHKKVIIFKYLSVFPTTFDPVELEKTKQYFIENYIFSRKSEVPKNYKLDIDFARILKQKIEEVKESVDEKFERQNMEKHERILPFLQVLAKVGEPKFHKERKNHATTAKINVEKKKVQTKSAHKLFKKPTKNDQVKKTAKKRVRVKEDSDTSDANEAPKRKRTKTK